MVITHCKNDLYALRNLVSNLTQEQYVYVSNCLEGGSLGQHLRHVLEFYTCLLKGREQGKINYDTRQRDLRISNDHSFALQRMDEIIDLLGEGAADCPLLLEGQFGLEETSQMATPTSFQRELIYCLEHSIHHQALMRVVLKEMGLVHLADKHFGVASSTVRFRQGSSGE